ncbi:MAG: phosphate ABC transporter ATP-binding protein [Bdellovibrionaceae bacterium]|nr:phosphate ABC transporter ATP-binding protein [Pseudobdellovibrionaceae bacterium]
MTTNTNLNLRAEVKDLSFSYGPKKVLNRVSMPIYENRITALIGPSGCGKTTLLRCFNRMHDLYAATNYDGEILLHPEKRNVLARDVDPMEVRMRIGMVFQKPNPFPKSIFENVAYGLRVRGVRKRSFIEDRVEKSLQQAGLWSEVKDRLPSPATALSGGQQQRLCIARALATEPEILLLDEPTSALDPETVKEVLGVIQEIAAEGMTCLLVTHEMRFAREAADYLYFMDQGRVVEHGIAGQVFDAPADARTRAFLDKVL